jgi:hypothetical protein
MSRSDFRKAVIATGATKKDADQMYRDSKKQETHVNDTYLVQIDRDCEHGFGPKNCPGGMFELTIRRLDRGPMHDWRHVQQIKNEIVGKENEMVELYPAESRLRDSANQYWFYGFNDPKVCFPFGMLGRFVDDGNDFGPSRQRRT